MKTGNCENPERHPDFPLPSSVIGTTSSLSCPGHQGPKQCFHHSEPKGTLCPADHPLPSLHSPPQRPRLPGPVPPSRQPWGDPALVPQWLTQHPRQRDPAAVERGEDQQHGCHVEDDVSEEGPGGRREGTQDGDPTGHHGGDQHARACGRGGQARSAPRPPPAALPAPSPAAGAARSYQTGPQRPGQLCAGLRRPPGR